MIFTENFFPIVNRLILFSSVLFLLILSVAYAKHLLKNLQSLSDLDRCYGVMERKSMLNNFLYMAILGVSDTDTQEYFAKMIGHKTKTVYSKTTGNGSTSITEHQEETWAIEPASLGRLQKKLVLLHPAGYDLLRKAPYYKYEKQKRKNS